MLSSPYNDILKSFALKSGKRLGTPFSIAKGMSWPGTIIFAILRAFLILLLASLIS
jgi:hypothetical protein